MEALAIVIANQSLARLRVNQKLDEVFIQENSRFFPQSIHVCIEDSKWHYPEGCHSSPLILSLFHYDNHRPALQIETLCFLIATVSPPVDYDYDSEDLSEDERYLVGEEPEDRKFTLSVNIPEADLGDYEFAVKYWANPDKVVPLVKRLQKAGLIHDTGKRTWSGFIDEIPIFQLGFDLARRFDILRGQSPYKSPPQQSTLSKMLSLL